MSSLKLYKHEIDDELIRENMFRIERYVEEDLFRKGGFRFLQFSVTAAVSSLRIPHNLKYIPLDVILMSVRNSDATSVTWHYDDFTRDSIYVSTDGPATIRAFLGRYEES